MYRWLLIALGGYIVYRMFKNDVKARAERRKRDEAGRCDSGEMARDPVCGTFVGMEDAVTVRRNGDVYYFCGYDCRDAFLRRLQNGESPESIIAGAKPMHPADNKNFQADEPPSARPGDDSQGKG